MKLMFSGNGQGFLIKRMNTFKIGTNEYCQNYNTQINLV